MFINVLHRYSSTLKPYERDRRTNGQTDVGRLCLLPTHGAEA